MKIKFYIFSSCLLLLISNNKLAASDLNKYISIEKLEKEGIINTEIRSSGAYQEECINLKIHNNINDTVYVFIEPGRRLISEDSVIQDILILKSYEVILTPLASVLVNVFGFCCQSSNAAPSNNSIFDVGMMAPENWVKLAEFADNNSFPSNALQHAVWVISNNHPVSSIHHEKAELVYPLKKFVAKLKNIELPWYSLTFIKDTSSLFSHKPEKIWGKIDYILKNNTIISVNIRDSNNAVVAELIKEVAKGPGNYSYYLEFSVKNWPKGEYSIYIIEDYSNINVVKKFKL